MLLLPLLQDAIPDTTGYMLFGYAIFLGLPALYLISWFLRRRNLERDPRVAVSIVDPVDLYRYVEIRGVVERIEPDEDMAFINSMARKYQGQETYTGGKPGDEYVVVVIRPERVSGMG